MKFSTTFIALALVFTSPTFAASLNFDKFDSGTTLGWSGQYVASGGAVDNGGYLRVTSDYPGTGNLEYRWMGNFSQIGAGQVSVDLMCPPTSDPLPMTVKIYGPQSTIDQWLSTQIFTIPNDGIWRTYTYILNSEHFTDVTYIPGLYTFEQALQSVIFFAILDARGELASVQTLCLDNIRLAAVPEPSTLLLLTLVAISYFAKRPATRNSKKRL